MKKFTFLFVLFFCAKIAFGQWQSIDMINSSKARIIFNTDQSLLLLCERGRALYKSTDNGLTWEKKLIFPTVNNIYDGTGFRNIITKGDTILMCSFNTIYRSFDDGNSWSQTPTPSMSTDCFFINNTMYSYNNFNWGCVFKSTNFGQTWVQDCSSAISNLRITSLINTDSLIYGITLMDTAVKLVRIRNENSYDIIADIHHHFLGLDVSDQKIAYINYSYTDSIAFINISNNQGLTWNSLSLPYCPYSVTTKGDTIYIALNDSVAYTINDGLSWTKVSGLSQYKYIEKYDYINGIEYIYSSMGTFNRRTIFSDWESININYPSILPWWLKVKNNHLFYCEGVGYVRKPIGESNDKLLRVYEDSNIFIHYLNIFGNNIYSLDPSIGLLRSEDNGNSWSQVTFDIQNLNLSEYSIYNMTERNDTLYLIFSEYREAYYILMSVDDGINWTTIFSETNLNSWITTSDFTTFFLRDNSLFVGYADIGYGYYRKYNIHNGVISNYSNLMSPTSFVHCIGDLIISNDYKSYDYGNTWIPCGNGLPTDYYPIDYVFFGNDSILFCFVQFEHDIFASVNQGDSWFSIKDNLQNKYIQAADFHNDTLYVITSYDSVYVRSINDIAAICVSGKVFYDNDGDNEFDANVDMPAPGLKVYSTNSSTNYTTNLQGNYYLFLSESSESDTIRVLNSLLYSTVTPEHYIVNQADTSKNFAIARIPGINDLRVDLTYQMVPRPGFEYIIYVTCKNEGTTTLNANLSLTLDDFFVYQNASEPPTSVLGNLINWNIPNFLPLQTKTFIVNLNLPSTTPLGEQVFVTATISPILGDTTMENNTDSISDIVVGSYDPNDKLVNRPMYLSPLQVLNKTEMVYTVRFQNTGTWYAENVSILDTMHHHLDLSTFRVIAASHDYNFDFTGNGIVRFNFPNINLPDSNMNEAASHGFIKYAIRLKNTIPLNDSITNTAHIYFDFNEAIVTNTTMNIVKVDASINEISEDFNVVVYPNPAKTQLNIRFEKADSYQISMYSIDGRLVFNEKTNNAQHSIHVASLNKGIYLLKISDEKRSKIVKIVIQ